MHLADYRISLAAAAIAFSLAQWGCDGNALTEPTGPTGAINFSREITLTDLEGALGTGIARVEVDLFSEGLVARRVLLARPEKTGEAEEIESQIIAIQTTDGDESVTLALGGLQIGFGGQTHFGAPDRDQLSFGAFVERVQASLAEGSEPRVRARREPPDAPQPPDVADFNAGSLVLLAESEHPALAVNVSGENLEVNANRQDGQPDAWLNIFGLRIELRVSDGVTELGSEEATTSDAVQFEGHVASVDLEASSFTFSDGSVVRAVDGTHIFEADVEHPLTSLAEVKAALENGLDVVAWGGGTLESVEPRVIVALELRFAVSGGGPEIIDFEGHVSSVNLEASTFTLTNGTIVSVVEGTTHLVTTGDGELLGSLAAAKEALDAGKDVVAWGAAEVQGNEPLTLLALEIRFLVTNPGPTVESFEGTVASVNLDLHQFTLSSGTVVRLTDGTQIQQAEQGQPLMSLEAVRDALESGSGVVAWGSGEVEGVEPLKLAATEVYFVLAQ